MWKQRCATFTSESLSRRLVCGSTFTIIIIIYFFHFYTFFSISRGDPPRDSLIASEASGGEASLPGKHQGSPPPVDQSSPPTPRDLRGSPNPGPGVGHSTGGREDSEAGGRGTRADALGGYGLVFWPMRHGITGPR